MNFPKFYTCQKVGILINRFILYPPEIPVLCSPVSSAASSSIFTCILQSLRFYIYLYPPEPRFYIYLYPPAPPILFLPVSSRASNSIFTCFFQNLQFYIYLYPPEPPVLYLPVSSTASCSIFTCILQSLQFCSFYSVNYLVCPLLGSLILSRNF